MTRFWKQHRVGSGPAKLSDIFNSIVCAYNTLIRETYCCILCVQKWGTRMHLKTLDVWCPLVTLLFTYYQNRCKNFKSWHQGFPNDFLKLDLPIIGAELDPGLVCTVFQERNCLTWVRKWRHKSLTWRDLISILSRSCKIDYLTDMQNNASLIQIGLE